MERSIQHTLIRFQFLDFIFNPKLRFSDVSRELSLQQSIGQSVPFQGAQSTNLKVV
jgi:hypothetical protein